VTLRGEPTWGSLAAPTAAPSVNGTAGADRGRTRSASTPPTPARGTTGAGESTTENLEAEVYAARDLHGDERAKARRLLGKARSRMADETYRRALELARDSSLLTIEECLDGARAMEWEPLPRPEFSLATIEAAVAEQEQAESSPADRGL